MNDDNDSVGWALLGLGLFPLFVLFFVWLICAVVAAVIADHRGRSAGAFFAVTFFFLGPLGPGIALLAGREINGVPLERLPSLPSEAKRAIAAGRQRFTCPRCGVDNDIPEADKAYDCWRCNEHRNVKPKV